MRNDGSVCLYCSWGHCAVHHLASVVKLSTVLSLGIWLDLRVFIAARIIFNKVSDIVVVRTTAGSPCFILKVSVSGPVAFSVCTSGLLMCSGLAS